MNRKIIFLFIVFIVLMPMTGSIAAAPQLKIAVNNKLFSDYKIINNQTYVHLNKFASQLKLSLKTDPKTKTIFVSDSKKTMPTPEIVFVTLPTPTPQIITITLPTPTPEVIKMSMPSPTPQIIYVTVNPTPTPTPTPKAMITKNDLPYRYDAKNEMSLTINSYTVTSGGIQMNITLTNRSSLLDKGKIMTSTWELYDGKSTLEHVKQDSIFYNSYLRSGQSITGNVTFQGITHTTDSVTLYGSLWQYINSEDFKLILKVE